MKDLITIDIICDRYQCERHIDDITWNDLDMNRLFARASDLEEWERSQMIYPVTKGVRKQSETHLIPRRKTV